MDAQAITPRRGKGHCIESPAIKGTPKQKRGQPQIAEGGKGTPKRKKMALKVVAAEALEEPKKVSKRTEDFEDDTDNEGIVTKSGSSSLEGGGEESKKVSLITH